ncbi:hypothetical protein TYRP_008949 [Tyrophagus putrescentiae]|nr:hypothetical protein TYRP_008949 [Tyrophagus putrescentiae]
MFPVHLNPFSSPFLCLDTSTLVAYLYSVQCAQQQQQQQPQQHSKSSSSSTTQTHSDFPVFSTAYRRLVKIKAVQYATCTLIAARVLYFSTLVLQLHPQRDHHQEEGGESPMSLLLALEGHRPFNPLLVGLHRQYHFFNAITLRCIALFGLYGVAIDWLVFFQIDCRLVQGAHQLIVLNGRHFVLLNSSAAAAAGGGGGGGESKGKGQLWTRLRRTVSVYRRAWNCPEASHFSYSTLASFPTFSAEVRAKAVVYSAALQQVVVLLNASLSNLEFVLIFALLYNIVREAFILLHYALLFSLITGRHLAEEATALARALRQSTLFIFRYRFLESFRREHRWLLLTAQATNGSIVSRILLATLVTNLVLNVVLIGNLLFNRALGVSERVVMVIVVAIQTGTVSVACLTMISWSDCFTRAAGLLYRTQMRMTTWEEEGDKGGGEKRRRRGYVRPGPVPGAEFRFTVGQLAKISQKSMAEFAIIYSGLIFYVAKMIRRGRL